MGVFRPDKFTFYVLMVALSIVSIFTFSSFNYSTVAFGSFFVLILFTALAFYNWISVTLGGFDT